MGEHSITSDSHTSVWTHRLLRHRYAYPTLLGGSVIRELNTPNHKWTKKNPGICNFHQSPTLYHQPTTTGGWRLLHHPSVMHGRWCNPLLEKEREEHAYIRIGRKRKKKAKRGSQREIIIPERDNRHIETNSVGRTTPFTSSRKVKKLLLLLSLSRDYLKISHGKTQHTKKKRGKLLWCVSEGNAKTPHLAKGRRDLVKVERIPVFMNWVTLIYMGKSDVPITLFMHYLL